jgi:transposase
MKIWSKEGKELALRPLSDEEINNLSAKDARALLRGEQKIRLQYEQWLTEAEQFQKELEEKVILLDGMLVRIKSRVWNPRSEKNKNCSPKKPANPNGGDKSRKRDLLDKYPDAKVKEKFITLETPPSCKCCSTQMQEMNQYEESCQLSVIPKQYFITKILRMKYRCGKCHGDVQTAPQLPRIIKQSTYGDDVIIDATLSKFCDLIPMERYCKIAMRAGFAGLSPCTLIDHSIALAMFMLKVYELIVQGCLEARYLSVDESPHRMLEGDEKKRWYLWAFHSGAGVFYECRDTREAEVAQGVLEKAKCVATMTDAYSGYFSAITEVNEQRKQKGLSLIAMALCNAHARRYFFEALPLDDAAVFVFGYQLIYEMEREIKESPLLTWEERKAKRANMRPIFEAMKEDAAKLLLSYSSHSNLYKACQYFINHFVGLTYCLEAPDIPLNNNHTERVLRSPAVGRKIWYGTHSKDGAWAMSVHFSIVESCKMLGVNPRDYYAYAVNTIHSAQVPLTPYQYKIKN